ncbi:MAG: hypothetical protein ACR65R_11840 [Methylomicrobium sp.]
MKHFFSITIRKRWVISSEQCLSHTYSPTKALNTFRQIPYGLLVVKENRQKLFIWQQFFKPYRTTTGTYDHPDFKNAAYGVGRIFGESLQFNGLPWFEALKAGQQNFRNRLFGITDFNTIEALTKLASGPYLVIGNFCRY